VFYQYNFHSAANIYAGMLQTESPYFQPTPPPPAPFAAVVGLFPGDPDYTCAAGDEFSGCDESWSVIMTGSENIFIAGAGIYSVSDNRDADRHSFVPITAPCIYFQHYDKCAMLTTRSSSGSRPIHKAASIRSYVKRRSCFSKTILPTSVSRIL
jgi:hypothetical protein